jgi:sialidase-1
VLQTTVFRRGEAGYHTFRIPAAVTTPSGTVLAFCEGRRHNRTDFGDIDLLLKRSFDGGRTWGALQVVATAGDHKVGNPTPLIDSITGVIWLPVLHQTGTAEEQQQMGRDGVGRIEVWLTCSSDDGATWADPTDITSQVQDPRSSFAIIGPGVGIQLRNGRLLIPAYFKTGFGKETFTNALWSDDHGKTWQHGTVCTQGANECQAVELSDGSIMLNMRNHRGDKQRLVAISQNGGMTWGEARLEPQLVEPVCQASILGCAAGMLFSNPASTGRTNMTVKLSRDEGKTWSAGRELWPGPSGYSCLTILNDGTVGCLYEQGDEDYCERLVFARFELDWLSVPSRD